MASPALWKDYFDNPTFSDLAIRLSDRVLHVHRIVLCRGSEYFDTLLTRNFKESGANEVSLRGDDPRTAVELLQFIYGLDYDQSHRDAMCEMRSLAATYVTAAKYRVVELENKSEDEVRKIITGKKLCSWDPDRVDDFLNVTEAVVAGTTQEDCWMRKLIIDWCFWLNAFITLYATAGKYLMSDLQREVTARIGSLTLYHHNEGVISDVPSFIAALRDIVAFPSREDYDRKYMVTACIKNLALLQKEVEFISMLRACGDLGAEIIGHKDLERGLLGSWMCGKACEATPMPQCSACASSFDVDFAWNQRYLLLLWYEESEQSTIPICAHCEEELEWVRRGITDGVV